MKKLGSIGYLLDVFTDIFVILGPLSRDNTSRDHPISKSIFTHRFSVVDSPYIAMKEGVLLTFDSYQ